MTRGGVIRGDVASGDVAWDDVAWDNVGWDNVGWDNAGWDNAGWDNAGWDNAGWDNSGWHKVAWDNVAWGDAAPSGQGGAALPAAGNTTRRAEGNAARPGSRAELDRALVSVALIALAEAACCGAVRNTQTGGVRRARIAPARAGKRPRRKTCAARPASAL